MDESAPPDLHDALQVSPSTDAETIDRVFRHLAKRYHPDNAGSGNAERSTLVMQAFADRPGLGIVELERMLGCPEHHLKFHVWYLRGNGLVQRLDNGQLALTSRGGDWALDLGGPVHTGRALLQAGDGAANGSADGSANGAATAAAG